MNERITSAVMKAKGDTMKEFEKLCPTDKSFDRVLKEIHRVFDKAQLDSEGLKKAKGDVVKLCEILCPTDRSFERVKKEMHDIFDVLSRDVQPYIKQ